MADWISATTLMLRSSLSARRRFLRTGKNSGSPRFTLASTLALRCWMSAAVDQPAVDPVAQHGFHVVGIGLNAQGGGRIADAVAAAWRPGPGSTKRTPRGAVGRGEQPQETLAVAVFAADDLLLPLVPLVVADEIVQHGLHLGAASSAAASRFLRRACTR